MVRETKQPIALSTRRVNRLTYDHFRRLEDVYYRLDAVRAVLDSQDSPDCILSTAGAKIVLRDTMLELNALMIVVTEILDASDDEGGAQ